MPSRLLQMRTADGTALTASSTETVLDSIALPPGSLGNGKQIRISGVVIATATNSTDTLTVKAYHHTAAAVASGTALGTSGAVDAANNDTCNFEIIVSAQSAQGSTSGTLVVTGYMSAVGAEGTVTQRGVYQKLTAVDLTATQYLGVTAQWSSTNSGNSCVIQMFDVVEITG